MNGFDAARGVEARALVHLLPFLRERSDGRLVLTNKSALARFLQETVGDALFNTGEDRLWSVEIKAEARETGNLFLEIWSNRNLENQVSHAMRGSNPGWLFKLRADLFFYYFLDTENLYIANLFKLQQWAFGCGEQTARIWRYPQRQQRKYDQENDTWGAIVPIADLSAIGLRRIHPRQIPMFPEAA